MRERDPIRIAREMGRLAREMIDERKS